MKKILVSLLMLPVILFSFIGQGLIAHAGTIEENQAFSETNSLEYYSDSDFINAFGLGDTDKYISIQGWFYFYNKYNGLATSIIYSDTLFWYTAADNIKSAELSGTILTVELNEVKPVYYAEKVFRTPSDHSNSVSISTSNTLCSADILEIDFSTYEFSFFNGTAEQTLHSMITTENPFNVVSVTGNFDNMPSEGLSVDVSFSPLLSGVVDRQMNVDGQELYNSGFTMTVKNNSTSSVQYQMKIHEVGSDSEYANYYFYRNEWVYGSSLDNQTDYWNEVYQKYNKSTSWHYIKSGGSDVQRFKWSQLPLLEGKEYNVVVSAILTDYDIASEKLVYLATSEAAYPEYKQLLGDNIEIVYESVFTVKYLGDVQYDYSDSSNGIIPYSSNEDFQRYAYSYNAVENELGIIDYDGKNLYDNKDSWVHGSGQLANDSYVYPGSSYDSFLEIASDYLYFLSGVMSYFPAWLWYIISLGFFTIIIVSVIKRIG